MVSYLIIYYATIHFDFNLLFCPWKLLTHLSPLMVGVESEKIAKLFFVANIAEILERLSLIA